MKHFKKSLKSLYIILTIFLVSFIGTYLTSPSNDINNIIINSILESEEYVSLSDIPEYSEKPYICINNNIPFLRKLI